MRCCGKKGILDSAHLNHEDRTIIIDKLLDSLNESSNSEVLRINLLKFEKEFLDAHLPVFDHFFFICKECHSKYDNGEIDLKRVGDAVTMK